MAFLAKLGGVARQSVKTLLWPAATRAICNSTNSLGSSTPAISHSVGISQGLWGQRTGFVGSMWGAGNQQVRNVMVEVTHDDLERAIRKMKRRLKDDNGIKLLRERQYFRKPSELKVLARKERDKRVAKKAFRAKLKWIQARQSRGFWDFCLGAADILLIMILQVRLHMESEEWRSDDVGRWAAYCLPTLGVECRFVSRCSCLLYLCVSQLVVSIQLEAVSALWYGLAEKGFTGKRTHRHNVNISLWTWSDLDSFQIKSS